MKKVGVLIALLMPIQWLAAEDIIPPPTAPPLLSRDHEVPKPVVVPFAETVQPRTQAAVETSFKTRSTPVSYWKESADTLSNVTLSVSTGYDVVITNLQIEGTGAFHLVHPDGLSTEIISLTPSFSISADSKLFLESRLGIATSDQIAEIQLSNNDAATWSTIWTQSGLGWPGQETFQRQEISLAAWTGQTIMLRMRYIFNGGSYYPGTNTAYGWLIDDIQIGTEYIISPTAYSIGAPTDKEQQSLEFINRARASASAEAIRLRDDDDPDVVNAKNVFSVNDDMMITQFGTLTETVPPLAFNKKLIAAARLHSHDMFNNKFQGHVSSTNPPLPNLPGDTLGTRISRQDYDYATASENVYSYANSIWHAHAGFNIDWGYGPGGMQDPPGHRLSIHNANFREIGIGIHEGVNGSVGPILITQDFGTSQSMNQPFITGIAWDDQNENEAYDPGEGISNINVIVEGERFMAVTSSSGGYAIPLPGDGVYTVSFESDIHPDWLTTTQIISNQNVKLDYALANVSAVASFAYIMINDTTISLSVTNAYRQPVLQISTNLITWSNRLDVTPAYQGSNRYDAAFPIDNVPAAFYRFAFP